MKGLYVNHAFGTSSMNNLKTYNSKEIKLRRYDEFFFKHTVFEMYSFLSFISVKFDFDIKLLLEIFLENLYSEEKVDEYVYQMSRMEDKEEYVDFYWLLLEPVLKHYMNSKEVEQDKRCSVLQDLYMLMHINSAVMLLNYGIWGLEFFYIKKLNTVKFYGKKFIAEKVQRIIKKICYKGMEVPIFIEFLDYMIKTFFLHDTDTNKQIEEILSRYYLVYRKNMEHTQRIDNH